MINKPNAYIVRYYGNSRDPSTSIINEIGDIWNFNNFIDVTPIYIEYGKPIEDKTIDDIIREKRKLFKEEQEKHQAAYDKKQMIKYDKKHKEWLKKI